MEILAAVRKNIAKSYERGLFWGTLDVLFKLCALIVWLFVVLSIIYIIYSAFRYEFDFQVQAWYMGYSFLVFITISFLAYTALFERR